LSPGNFKQAEQERETFAQRVLTAVGISVSVILLLLFAWFAMDVLLLAFAGVLLAIFSSQVKRLDKQLHTTDKRPGIGRCHRRRLSYCRPEYLAADARRRPPDRSARRNSAAAGGTFGI